MLECSEILKACIFLHKYSNILKQEESATKLKKHYEGSMTIANFITQAEDLNLYACFDMETLPTLFKPRLNIALQGALQVAKPIHPITTQ